MRNEELLIRLTQTQGIAGYEKKVRELIEQEVRPYADELIVDPLGSLIAVKKGKAISGVKTQNLDDGDKVASIAVIPASEIESED